MPRSSNRDLGDILDEMRNIVIKQARQLGHIPGPSGDLIELEKTAKALENIADKLERLLVVQKEQSGAGQKVQQVEIVGDRRRQVRLPTEDLSRQDR